jgi:methionyl-tRNA formyltransferase
MSKVKSKIKTIFIGTPTFAVPSLKHLINDKQFDIIAVVTQPDKKIGRKQILTPTPVKVEAEKFRIPVYQPEKISDEGLRMANFRPDLIIVVAYAQIIPENILNIPKYGIVNVHGSLLPKYRGASCIQAAILNGDKKTGVTIMKMDKGLDTGPILAQSLIDILPTDTTGSLYEKLSELGAKTLLPTLKEYIAGKIKPRPQNHSCASYVGLLKKQDGKIDWEKSAVKVERFIRAMTPWPSAFTIIDARTQTADDRNRNWILKILRAEYEPLKVNNYKVGELFSRGNKLAVQCGKDALIIKKLQLEGKKELTAEEFLRGYKKLIGCVLT